MTMRTSVTTVLERHATFTSDFDTEPYECGWASEARWFVRLLEIAGDDAALLVSPQISPDGLFWCEEGTAPSVIREPGLYSDTVREFGQWLRLHCQVRGGQPSVKVLMYLALKE